MGENVQNETSLQHHLSATHLRPTGTMLAGVVSSYLHMSPSPCIGRIGVLVSLKAEDGNALDQVGGTFMHWHSDKSCTAAATPAQPSH